MSEFYLIDNQPFVRIDGSTLPLAEWLTRLARRERDLLAVRRIADAAVALSGPDLVQALVTGDDVEVSRQRFSTAMDDADNVREQLQHLAETAAEISQKHAAAIAKSTFTKLAANLNDLTKNLENELRSISA